MNLHVSEVVIECLGEEGVEDGSGTTAVSIDGKEYKERCTKIVVKRHRDYVPVMSFLPLKNGGLAN